MKKIFIFVSLVVIVILSGCMNDDTKKAPVKNTSGSKEHDMDHSQMNHSSNEELPAGLKSAANPKYKVGMEAKVLVDHMKGEL